MAQKTAWTGAVLTESDINTYLMHEGGAWTSWTPVVTQTATPTLTNTRSRWGRAGRLVYFSFDVLITSAGTAGAQVIVTLPATSATASGVGFGQGFLFDASVATWYPYQMQFLSTTTFNLQRLVETTTPSLGVSGFTAALANTDIIRGHGWYEST